MCQQKIQFVLTFTQNDLTLVEIYTVVLHFGLDTCQIKLGLYRSTPKVLGKCHVSCCYVMLCNSVSYTIRDRDAYRAPMSPRLSDV